MEMVMESSAPARQVAVTAIYAAGPLWETAGEADAYMRGAHDGNAAAVRLLLGVCLPIRLVVDETIPEGECRLHVRSLEDVKLSGIHLDLLTQKET